MRARAHGERAVRGDACRHPAFARLCALCAALPASECRARGDHADFRVRGRVYAYFLDNHHGDGIVSVCVKSALGEHVDRVARDPDRYYLPAYIGSRGWFGLKLNRPRIDWREVGEIVTASYRLVAPARLVAALDHPAPADAGAPRRARVRT